MKNLKMTISKKVREIFPELDQIMLPVYGLKVDFGQKILNQDSLGKMLEKSREKDFFENKKLKSFRDFYERLELDPYSEPPAVENLYRRFLEEGKLPQVNSVVDSQNLVAMQTLVPMGVFDIDKIEGQLFLRFAQKDEEFRPLGGGLEFLSEKAVIISDNKKALNKFPYKDSIYQKIGRETKNVLILGDLVKGLNRKDVEKAVSQTAKEIVKNCGGEVGEMFTAKEEKINISFSKTPKSKKRVFSGTRATGRLHLGNYLGAVKGYIALQEDPRYECVFMAVDLHTITTPYDHKKLNQATKDIIMDYLAAGLDPEKSIITAQSLVPEHAELSFLFSSVMTVARMQHLPTFKDKVKQHPDNVTMALLNYPVLMAADILVYKAELVPVGVDQEPHLEVAREVARKMNDRFGTNYPEPERFITQGEYIPSLTGEGKMSKSVKGSYINLTDSLKQIKEKVAGVPTDSGKGERIPQEGGVAALLKLVEIFQGNNKKRQYEKSYLNDGLRYSDLKTDLSEAIYKNLEPIRKKRKELEENPEYVEGVIREGAKKAREIAKKTLKETKEKMGLMV